MIRRFALIFGLVYTLVGILGVAEVGFADEETHLLGLFPVNGAHNVVHFLIGIPGIAAYFAGYAASRAYAWFFGVVLIAVGLLGFVEPDFFGIMPIGGNDIWLHLASGIVALGFAIYSQQRVEAHR